MASAPHSANCNVALWACRVTHAASGLAVGLQTSTQRILTWKKNRTYRLTNPVAVRVRTETKSLPHSVAACQRVWDYVSSSGRISGALTHHRVENTSRSAGYSASEAGASLRLTHGPPSSASDMPPAVRLGAVRAVIELGLKVREVAELEARIAALERMADEAAV